VALTAIKGEEMLAELARHYDVHPTQVTALRAQVENVTLPRSASEEARLEARSSA
jgi:hypothetical protein